MNTRPRRCPFCRGPSPAPGRACAKPRCQAAERRAWRARDAKRRKRKQGRCRFCSSAPLEGRRVCAAHATRGQPCLWDGCAVPYHDGPGPQRVYGTPACRQAARSSRRSPEPSPAK